VCKIGRARSNYGILAVVGGQFDLPWLPSILAMIDVI